LWFNVSKLKLLRIQTVFEVFIKGSWLLAFILIFIMQKIEK
jgi:hypothetical protein